MFIIADSGSTKADWTVVKEDGSNFTVSTMGFNPFYHDSDFIENELKKEFVLKVPCTEIKKVMYYGTGIHDNFRAEIVAKALQNIMPNANISVEHDLLASAHATCGSDAGIACIIGTGSNTCLYDGKKVLDNVSNLGFMAGDEGSGSDLGRRLIQAYFYRELPIELKDDFDEKYPEGATSIKNRLYEPGANVFLASFTRFLSEHKDHYYVQKLVGAAFASLIDRHISKYQGNTTLPIHFVGSIAYYFQDVLRIELHIRGMKLGKIIRKPIDALVAFHLSNEN
jgi:glucosamine kinase